VLQGEGRFGQTDGPFAGAGVDRQGRSDVGVYPQSCSGQRSPKGSPLGPLSSDDDISSDGIDDEGKGPRIASRKQESCSVEMEMWMIRDCCPKSALLQHMKDDAILASSPPPGVNPPCHQQTSIAHVILHLSSPSARRFFYQLTNCPAGNVSTHAYCH
jgi:hypothetical protein